MPRAKLLLGVLLAAALCCCGASSAHNDVAGDWVEVAESTGTPFLVKPGVPHGTATRGLFSPDVVRQRNFASFLKKYYGSDLGEMTPKFSGPSGIGGEGASLVHYFQHYRGLPVIGASLKVIFDREQNVVQASGKIVANIDLDVQPSVTQKQAEEIALRYKVIVLGMPGAYVHSSTLSVFRVGLLTGLPGYNILVWDMRLWSSSSSVKYALRINARSGEVISCRPETPTALDRKMVESSTGNIYWVEGDPTPSDKDSQEFLSASKDVYNTWKNMFNWASYNNKDSPWVANMHIDDTWQCPNAWWDPSTNTINCCTNLARYDVIGHEMGHSLSTSMDHSIYEYYSGALEEAWADITGESVQILWNGTAYYPTRSSRECVSKSQGDSLRWIVGDNSETFNYGLRDMFNPTCYDNPASVSSIVCSPFDNSGVHTNSGPPSIVYSTVADGGAYIGNYYAGIGIIKAYTVFFYNKYHYQTSSETFNEWATHLAAACADLQAQTNNLVDQFGQTTNLHVTADDCQTIHLVLSAVGFLAPACTAYYYWGTFPPYIATTGGKVTSYTSGTPTTTEYMKVEGQSISAAVSYYTMLENTNGWNQVATFTVPSAASLGVTDWQSRTLNYSISSDSLGYNPPTNGLKNSLRYYELPTIDSISPSSGDTGGGTVVEVSGENFQNFYGPCGVETYKDHDCFTCVWYEDKEEKTRISVTFSGYKDGNTAVCTSPAHAEGTIYLDISLNQQDITGNPQAFTVHAAGWSSPASSLHSSVAALVLAAAVYLLLWHH